MSDEQNEKDRSIYFALWQAERKIMTHYDEISVKVAKLRISFKLFLIINAVRSNQFVIDFNLSFLEKFPEKLQQIVKP